MPNIKVLNSIVDYSESAPTLDPSFPGATAVSYWSATTYVIAPNRACVNGFSSGFVAPDFKSLAYGVRAVRTGP